MIPSVAVPLPRPPVALPREAEREETRSFAGAITSRLRITELGVLTIVALAGYIWVAFWTRYHLHYVINDALSRNADAVYVGIGRDPHLAAIGFYWPPLPQLIQVPFVVALFRFHLTEMAGPITSSICVALTIVVIGKLCRRLGVGRVLTFTICLVFAANPVNIFNAAIGMSEACFFLVMSIALLGYFTYVKTGRTEDLLVMVAGLCACVLVRFEGLFVVIALSVLASFQLGRRDLRARLRQGLWRAFVIALPPFFLFGLWMLTQLVLLGDFFFFLHQGGGPLHHPGWAPNVSGHPWDAVPWAVRWMLTFGPVLILPAAALLIRPLRRLIGSTESKTRGNLGLLACTGVFVFVNCYLLIKDVTYGNPRYFEMACAYAALAVAWLVSTRPTWRARIWNIALVALLILGSATGSYALTNGKPTHTEGECQFFQLGVGHVLPFMHRSYSPKDPWACGLQYPLPDTLATYRQMGADLDRVTKPTDRILTDNALDLAAVLMTRYPKRYIVRNDSDWQRIIADPVGKVTYIVIPEQGSDATAAGDAGFAIVSGSSDQWVKFKTYETKDGGAIDVYKYHPLPPRTAPNVPQGVGTTGTG